MSLISKGVWAVWGEGGGDVQGIPLPHAWNYVDITLVHVLSQEIEDEFLQERFDSLVERITVSILYLYLP